MKLHTKCRSVALAGIASFALFSTLSSPLSAQEGGDAAQAAQRFGPRASVLDISLSPSGSKIAWVSPDKGHGEVLNVFDLNGDGSVKQIAANGEITGDITGCDWATDTRLVCKFYGLSRALDGTLLGYDRMFALSVDGSEAMTLTQRASSRSLTYNQDGGDLVALDVEGEEGQILLTRQHLKESALDTRISNSKEGLGVDLFDVNNGRRKIEEQPDDGAIYYLADENGEVRFKARAFADSQGFMIDKQVYMVRAEDSSRWERLEGVVLDGTPIDEFKPAALDGSTNSLLAYHTMNGFEKVIRIPLGNPAAASLVAGRDNVDVAGLIRIGRQRRVVGVSYAAEKLAVDYFDQELETLARNLTAALPNQPLINIVGASSDESKLLIIASSDTDPGTVYLFDKNTQQLEVLLAVRDELVEVPMGNMKPVSFPAADGTMIPGYLTLPAGSAGKNLPAVVLPHGGPAARDFWGFDWIVQFFTARGYAVLQPNFRGSTGYGEAWFGRNGFQAWDVAIGDVNDAGRWMVSEGIADPERLAIVGWSYGGYAALQSQVVDPDLYKAVVAIAPVVDLEMLREDARRYTSFRFRDEQLGEGPHIAAGSPRRHADKFAAPVALFHGTLDANVDVRHSRAMADALRDEGKTVEYVEYQDLEHSLRDSSARIEMLGKIDNFLSAALDK